MPIQQLSSVAGTPSRHRLARFLVRLILPGLLLGAPLTHAECVPAPAAPPPENVYTGYPNIGYKGAPEFDPLWHRRVITRRGQDGRDRYRLDTDRVWYDSLEPIDLGRVTGFIAHREGCARLLDRHGKPLPLPLFDEIIPEYLPESPPGEVIYRLNNGLFEHVSYSFVRFFRGRIAGVSPREYQYSTYVASLPPGILSRYLRPVELSGPPGRGLLDFHSMKEVLAPEWKGVQGIGFYGHQTGDGRARMLFLLADDGRTRTLFSRDGTTRVMAQIDSIAVAPEWLPAAAGKTATERAIITVIRSGEASCRVYDTQLNLLLPHSIPLIYGECPIRPYQQRPPYLYAEGFDGGIAIYSTQDAPRPQWIGSVPGELVARSYEQRSGLVIVRIRKEGGLYYRAYHYDGKLANDNDFTDFRIVSCGIFEVRQGQGEPWITLLHSGKTTLQRSAPFPCLL